MKQLPISINNIIKIETFGFEAFYLRF